MYINELETKAGLNPLMRTKKLMTDYAMKETPSHWRAQCLNIASYSYSYVTDVDRLETIAERLARDHHSIDGALRAAQLMVRAGAATESKAKPHLFGTFTFLDGSTLS